MDYQAIAAGSTERAFTVVQRSNGAPVTGGTVNYYLLARSGANAGKWWRDSDQTWQAAETANPMTHLADGHHEIDLTASPFTSGLRYLEYVKESGNLHVPDGRHLIARDINPATGAYPVTITMDDGADPLEGANVRLTNGALSYVATTDVAGLAGITVDGGTWTVAITKAGYQFTATTLAVAADTAHTYSMTLTVTPTASPDQVTGFLTCFDEEGAVEEDAAISLTQTAVGEATGIGYDGTVRTETSDETGLVQFPGLFIGATYQVWRGNARRDAVSFTIPAGSPDPVEITSLIGSP